MILEIALSFLFAILIGICTGIFTMFYSYCIGDPHLDKVHTRRIFSRFGVWLRHKYDDLEDSILRVAKEETMKAIRRPDQVEERELSKQQNWYKILGMCPICSNVYFSLILGSLSCCILSMNFFFLFVIVMFSHLTIRVWMAHF